MPGRKAVASLLKARGYIDVIIPRGGKELVQKVADESAIPVLYHAEGGARIYIDESADIETALRVCVNAKTSRPATCNSLDTVVVHSRIAGAFLPLLAKKLEPHRVEIRGDAQTRTLIKARSAEAKDYTTEFLDLILAVKIVNTLDEALCFIAQTSARHSEGIIAQNSNAIARFVNEIDAAALFINCSTRLHDGGVFEMGAEMGIATGKLHARGPVGLYELTTYKWVAYGSGQIRE
jgi:glutamate-5-semialdehyde dehydrogenase